jgi:hypothetical protein
VIPLCISPIFEAFFKIKFDLNLPFKTFACPQYICCISRWSPLCRNGGWSHLTYVCKTVGGLLTIALVCFFVEEYVTFGMWTANKYQLVTACSEEFYNFPFSESGDSLLEDRSLMTKCGVYRSNATDISNFTKVVNTVDKPPDIITKCGRQTPLLLSFRSIRSPDAFSNKIVPNIVHYISIGTWTFTFLNYLSFCSTEQHIKPNYIFVHGNELPHGEWWNRTLKEVPNVYHVARKRPLRIQGRKARWLEHSTDIIRLQTLLGMYNKNPVRVMCGSVTAMTRSYCFVKKLGICIIFNLFWSLKVKPWFLICR